MIAMQPDMVRLTEYFFSVQKIASLQTVWGCEKSVADSQPRSANSRRFF